MLLEFWSVFFNVLVLFSNVCSVVDNQRVYVDDYSFYLEIAMYVYDRQNNKLNIDPYEE